MASQLVTLMQDIGTFLKYGWVLILAIWFIFIYYRWKNWVIEAIIFEKRGNNLVKTNDRARRYYDSFSGINGYKMLKSKDTIPIMDFDWILHNVATPTNFFERFINLVRGNAGTIILFKYGSKQYKPIQIIQGDKAKIEWKELKDAKTGEPIFYYTYYPIDPRDKLAGLDFEVMDWDNMNFMIQEQRASIERRKAQKSWLYTIAIPAIMIAGAALVALIMIKFAYDWSLAIKGQSAPSQAQPENPNPNIPVIGDIIPGE